jgi:hypothetical protein
MSGTLEPLDPLELALLMEATGNLDEQTGDDRQGLDEVSRDEDPGDEGQPR